MTAAAPIADESKQSFDTAYRALIDSERLQTDMVQFQPPEPREPPNWLAQFMQWLETTGPVWQGLFWIVVVLVAGLILYAIGRALYNRFRYRPDKTDDEEENETLWRPEAETAHGLLGEADALAKQGRFAEAARLLLIRSVADIETRLPDFLKPALTSRDISKADALPAPARTAFTAIAEIVERGIFAVRPVDEQGWHEARTAYERFAFGKSWA